MPVCDNQAKRVLPAANYLTTPCLLADKVQSIDRAAHTAPPPTPQSAAHPSTTALPTVTTIAIIACAHPSSAAAARPHRAAFWKPFVCPRSIHPSNSGLPTQAHRAGAITLAARHPPTRKLRHQTLVAAARSAAEQEEPWRQRESALPLPSTHPVSPRLFLTYTPLSTTAPLHHPSSPRRCPPSPQHRRGSGATSSHPLCYCARCLVRVSHDSATSESDVSTPHLASHRSLLH